MTRHQYHYLRSLPGAIWTFASMAPLHKLPIIFQSIDRMANNSAILRGICDIEDVADRNVALRKVKRQADEQIERMNLP